MYRQNNGSNWRGRGQFDNRRNFNGRGRGRLRTFDPSFIINNGTSTLTQEEYVAKNAFGDFAISDKLKANVVKRGYKTPTPIQDQAIPEVLRGRDVVGTAHTGTGKTAAFLIPLIDKVFKNYHERVLIITPTRELAVQIEEELREFSQGMSIFSVLCIGGVNIEGQMRKLYKNPQFVIGTPGRLQDLERQRKLNFANFRNIVLDEVDRMLDMGFIQDVNYIVSKLPSPRHSLFFSATIPQKVQEVMESFSKDPIRIKVQSTPLVANIDQDVVRVNGKAKIEVLHDLLIQDGFHKVLIFGRTKFGIERLSQELTSRGFRVASIHGNKSQSRRQKALSQFKSNHIQVLLATDLASRGLDIDDVTHVINYELPETYEDYVHRIGRTGRADKKGKALTFVS